MHITHVDSQLLSAYDLHSFKRAKKMEDARHLPPIWPHARFREQRGHYVSGPRYPIGTIKITKKVQKIPSSWENIQSETWICMYFLDRILISENNCNTLNLETTVNKKPYFKYIYIYTYILHYYMSLGLEMGRPTRVLGWAGSDWGCFQWVWTRTKTHDFLW